MPVMNVGEVRVAMLQFVVLMRVNVRLRAIPFKIVCVLVMRIVPVGMAMLKWFVQVWVLMTFGQMQPDTKPHQQAGGPERRARSFTKHENGDGGSHEGGC